ncbi:MAG: hypothetical protein M0C28_18585 [Candidatus Moduliflexus flocculans]|nr:hypothetical protein [Candidatus Moduliflexus flocculans]
MDTMETIPLIIAAALSIALLITLGLGIPRLSAYKRSLRIAAAIASVLPEATLRRGGDRFDVETAGTPLPIKVLPMNPAHELILTNRYFSRERRPEELEAVEQAASRL